MKAYEHAKRHHVDPGLFKGPTVGFTRGELAVRERAYDPVLGRLRDERREQEQQQFEKEVTNDFMNLARDLQLRREASFDLVTHEKKFHALQPDSKEFKPDEVLDEYTTRTAFPDSCAEHNIISNLLKDEHHYTHPEMRPPAAQRIPKRRKVPAMLQKDFNILTNRYLQNNDAKLERDRELQLLDAAEKLREKNFFNPVKQTFCDDRMEQRMRAAEDAITTEIKLRGEDAQPLSNRGCITAGYDMITHQVKRPELMSAISAAEEGRKERYRTRHMAEVDVRIKDVVKEDADIQAKYDKTSHQRFEEVTKRGFDIVTGQNFGRRRDEKRLFMPKTKAFHSVTPWDKVTLGPQHEGTAGLDVATLRLPIGKAERPPSGALSARTTSTARAAREAGGQQRSLTPRSGPPPPPPPAIPGSPQGSVYSRPRQ